MGWIFFMFAVNRGIYFENNGSSPSVCNVYWIDNSTFGNVYGSNIIIILRVNSPEVQL